MKLNEEADVSGISTSAYYSASCTVNSKRRSVILILVPLKERDLRNMAILGSPIQGKLIHYVNMD